MKKVIFALLLLALPGYAYGAKCTIAYTGNSYSTLYPCGHCPASVGGGVTRRATLLQELKKQTKGLLIVDSGNFTAGGSFDEASINPQYDAARTAIYYKAMAAMGYDAAALGANEFSFGVDFLKEQIKQSPVKFVSANISLDSVVPFYIKNLGQFKVAITGLTPLSVFKTTGLPVQDYEQALTQVIAKTKGKCNFIVLLSPLGDEANAQLLKKFTQIKVVISSGDAITPTAEESIGDVTLLRPSFLAKELKIAELDIENNAIKNKTLKGEKLSLSVAEDTQIKRLIPTCFLDTNCPRKEGLIQLCQNPGEPTAQCIYKEAQKIEAKVISNLNCPFCSIEVTQKILTSSFPGINFTVIDYQDKEAKKLIAEYGLDTIPSFILPIEIKKEPIYAKIKNFFDEKKDAILAKKGLSGVFAFLKRKTSPRHIDYFVDFNDEQAAPVFNGLIEFSKENNVTLEVNLIMPPDTAKNPPNEETRVALCVKKVQPDKFAAYVLSRVNNKKTTPWIDTLEEMGIDYKKVKPLLKSPEMESFINKNNKLAKEIMVTEGNVILINNTLIFKVFEIRKEELKKFF